MLPKKDILKNFDVDVYNAIIAEEEREEYNLELIASENAVSEAVMEAQACVMTNKYAEGYPGKRYYGGCDDVDIVERLAIDRAKELFGCEHVNVQPHAGSQANFAVYFSVLEAGDTILGMDLPAGGHLTHGSKVNFSGKLFNSVGYGVNDNGYIDYDEAANIAEECKPKMIVAGASAYSRTLDFSKFREIADLVGAYLFVDIAHIAGLVAAGEHPSPIPYAEFVTTTTHKTLRGPRGGMIMCKEEFAKAIDRAVFPMMQGGPLMHIIAAKAVAFKEALTPEFKKYQAQTVKNAKTLADIFTKNNFKVVSGGTDNHLFLLDFRANEATAETTGKIVQKNLELANITISKSTVPGETRSPFVTSGIRIGTPAITTRGMKEKEMEKVGEYVIEAILNINNTETLNKIKKKVENLCREFPLYNKK